MAERKTTIYYNHNFYYDFSQIIAADDRGLQFGDGCYEWIRVYKGHPFALSYHTDRLYRSMRLLGIRPVTAPDEFTEIVETVVEESGIEEGYVKIIVTRGQGDHDFLIPARNQLRPNVLVYAKPISLDAIAKVQDGVKCITMKDDRGHHCDILSLSQVDNLLARQEALKQGCYDGIFIFRPAVSPDTLLPGLKTEGAFIPVDRRMATNLPRVYADGSDAQARSEMALAAYEAGVGIANSSVTVVHGLSRPIGALFHVAHGISNAMLLAKTLAYIADGALDRFASLGRAIGVATDADIDAVATEKFLAAVDALCATCKVPTLAEYGIDRDAFFARMDKMATDALASGSPANTRKALDKDDLLRIYESLWD